MVQDDAVRIEELIHDLHELEDVSATPGSTMGEHLEAARFYLLGAMPQEYRLSLKLAEQNLPNIANEGLRSRLANFLRSRQTERC
jgi:hypothetical protein